MLVVFGKGKVGNGIRNLLNFLKIENTMIDDQDFSPQILDRADQIIVSPGIKKSSHHIYQDYPDKIISELNFLGQILPEIGLNENLEIIGITATNGKSTTTRILYNIFQQLGLKKNIRLSGNFDEPLSQTIYEILKSGKAKEKNLIICECSSFMLYGLTDFHFDYSILLNIATDHLDRHTDFQEYSNSKINLLRNTKKSGFTNQEIFDKLNLDSKSKIRAFSGTFDLNFTQFIGKHNQQNLSAIVDLVQQYFTDHNLKFSSKKFNQILNGIQPLDHRLKLVKTTGDIKIYDDGICTSAQALNAALESFDEKVLLICGGYDKGENYNRLGDIFASKVGYAVLMGATSNKFEKICIEKNILHSQFDTLNDVIQHSLILAKDNNLKIILFSPGSASFDMFRNVYDRVEQFLSEIKKI